MLKSIRLAADFIFATFIPLGLKAANDEYKLGKIVIVSTGAIDLTPSKPRPYHRFAKWICPTTSPSLIHRYIHLKEGDALSREELLRIDKMLTALPYFSTASVTKNKPQLDSDASVADMVIKTKDRFPISLDLNLVEGPLLTLTHNNVWGYGHIFRNQLFLKKRWGYGLEYELPQMHGTYFVGGQWYKQTEITYMFDCKNAWLGKSFMIQRKLGLPPSYWITTFSGYEKTFGTRPTVSAIQNSPYHHYRFILGKIGFVIDGYQKEKGVYSLHSSELIPKGGSIEVLYGYQQGEFNERKYLGLSCIKNMANTSFGYLSFSCEAGAFIHKKSLEEGVLKLALDYAAPAKRTACNGMRPFIHLDYVSGYRMPKESTLGIKKSDPESLNKLKENTIYAIKKPINARLYLSIHGTFHTPILVNCIRFTLLGFSDFIALYDRDYNLLNTKLVDHCGLGFRLQHVTIQWPTIDLKLGYNPLLGKVIPSVTLSTCCFKNKTNPKPAVIQYN
ncbi:hypothetical protein [Cardinium endosymbiont of Tipula unca]|uniref:hypothetical protein n=1 Tax=Cardinium endosymbiont of Tipula unca TaxID=3066216 RepID=UPI0030CD9048